MGQLGNIEQSRLWRWAPSTLSERMARWGVVIVVCYALIVVMCPVLVHLGVLGDPNAGLQNPIYALPSLAHWCGTDRLGRDGCVRTFAGSGMGLGMLSGYLGGWTDRLLVLLMDNLYTLPVPLLSVVLALLLARGGADALRPSLLPGWGHQLRQCCQTGW
jgi:peptide/nickel transport system permease protein